MYRRKICQIKETMLSSRTVNWMKVKMMKRRMSLTWTNSRSSASRQSSDGSSRLYFAPSPYLNWSGWPGMQRTLWMSYRRLPSPSSRLCSSLTCLRWRRGCRSHAWWPCSKRSCSSSSLLLTSAKDPVVRTLLNVWQPLLIALLMSGKLSSRMRFFTRCSHSEFTWKEMTLWPSFTSFKSPRKSFLHQKLALLPAMGSARTWL